MVVARKLAPLFVLAFVAAVASCAQEEYPAWLWDAKHPTEAVPPVPDGGTQVDSVDKGPRTCPQANAEALPARVVAISADASTGGTVVLVDDVFARFTQVCGGCHGAGTANGNFLIASASEFKSGFTRADLQHVMSDGPSAGHQAMDPNDPNDPMPPLASANGKPFSQRNASDPVYQFAEIAQAWLAAGSPNSFMQSAGGDAGASASYALAPGTGDALTNIGDCIPSRGLVGIEQTKSTQLDTMFASLQPKKTGSAADIIGLPEHLSQTDLFSFDTATLAQYGVIAYAPGYPLWSDNAGKIRYIRVPRGTSIQFDKATQSFTIPANTRFYKTFLKQIVDKDGMMRWRKVETRLIVSRPQDPTLEGDSSVTSLYGSYQWREDESEADLVETPLLSGDPFADTVLQYNTNEPLAAAILATNPLVPEQALLEGNAMRHYAIPGSARCLECHQGSASRSFVLGFLPLQINRRPVGVGGVVEATGPDELTQMQRFVDYGLVTGMNSPADVLPLENAEGTRQPRNSQELRAQGYMLGNCSHCHNPHGAPSVQNPVLKPILNFLPGPDGGIFQFPLERFSPRILRGVSGTTPIPYITPSLVDEPLHSVTAPADLISDPFAQNAGTPPAAAIVYAPWRSLIYRNVDTAFSYTFDYALFPHMPRNTAGYDPRAKQFLSDWMVSIPAIRKHPELNEYTFCNNPPCELPGNADYTTDSLAKYFDGIPDVEPQPYVEIFPGDPRYAAAAQEAQHRLEILHTGAQDAIPLPSTSQLYSRYADPGQTDDIIDPNTIRDPICYPIPGQINGLPPSHPDWVRTDLSQPPPPWQPRRPDWQDILVDGKPEQGATALSCGSTGTVSTGGEAQALADEKLAIAALQGVTIDSGFKTFATTAVPFGLWQQKAGCNFAGQPTVGSLQSHPPRWFSHKQGLSPSAPVYSETPGAAVFKLICINCHGPLADSNGRLSKNLADMSGGLDVPADFRDGLFGPVGAAESASNRHMVYGIPLQNPNWSSTTDDDRAARYMAWMALGGTKKSIPTAILQIVGLTQVLGEPRPYLPAGIVSANMLSVAKAICQSLLGPGNGLSIPKDIDPTRGFALDYDGDPANGVPGNIIFLHDNGDADNWANLCTYNPPGGNHPSPVRVLLAASPAGQQCNSENKGVNLCEQPVYDENLTFVVKSGVGSGQLIDPASYASTKAPVGNDTGTVDSSLQGGNRWPWCVQLENPADTVAADYIKTKNLPVCPSSGVTYWDTDAANDWAVRAAINAGLAVFLYVNSLESMAAPPPDFNQCEQLAAPAAN